MPGTVSSKPLSLSDLRQFWKRGYTKFKRFRRTNAHPEPCTLLIETLSKSGACKAESDSSKLTFGCEKNSDPSGTRTFEFTFVFPGWPARKRTQAWEQNEALSLLLHNLTRLRISSMPECKSPKRLETLPAEIRQNIIVKFFGEPKLDYKIHESGTRTAPEFDTVAIRALATSSKILSGDILQVGALIARRILNRLHRIHNLSSSQASSESSATCPCTLCQKCQLRKSRGTAVASYTNSTKPESAAKLCGARIRHEKLILTGYATLLLRVLGPISRNARSGPIQVKSEDTASLEALRRYRQESAG